MRELTRGDIMQLNNLLIHLHNSIDAFSFKPRHLEQIRAALPVDVNIVVAADNADFMAKLPEADSALVWSFKPEWYDRGVRLKAVYTPAAGHDWVAQDPSGRVRTFYGSFHGRIMRESLLAMILYFNRQLGRSLDDQRNRRWGRLGYSSCAALFSQRVVIVGLGALGSSMAELLHAFGARITGVKRSLAGFAGNPNVDRVIAFDSLEEELPDADHVVLLLPGGSETDGLFTRRHFNALKQGACLFNLGRGNCFHEADLIHALEHGPLAGAGLDVFAEEPLPPDSPLWGHANVLITPHSSAISQEYIDLFVREWLGSIEQSRV